MDPPSVERIREAFEKNEPGRELLLARNSLSVAIIQVTEILGQTPTSLESFIKIINQFDSISEQLKSTARVMKWINYIQVTPKVEPSIETQQSM